ncbi:hypothetical protein B7463_g294, partial [Scytalidium lignicola]
MRGVLHTAAVGRLWIPLLVVAQLGLPFGTNADSLWPSWPSTDQFDSAPTVTSAAPDVSDFLSSLRNEHKSSQIPVSSTPLSSPTKPTSLPPSSSSSSSSIHSLTPAAAASTTIPSTFTSGALTITSNLASPISSSSVQADPLPSHGWSTRHRNLVIILSVVLGVFGLVLIISTIYFAFKYRRNHRPFGRRGASPINDEEIATWRGGSDRKDNLLRVSESELTPPRNTSGGRLFMDSSDQRLDSSPTAVPTFGTFPSSNRINTRPSVVRAPNARAGLTDDIIPGADPFIAPVKRKNSRLSKAPPGHGRSRSSRSSMSTKSMWNYQNERHYTTKDKMTSWYDPYDDCPCSDVTHSRRLSSSPTDSTHDLTITPLGGLSPRPASHFKHTVQSSLESDYDIGIAIS